jgi:signal transduction histidine kinase
MDKVRILIVEDEGVVALSIQRRLEKFGYEVPLVVVSGEEAITQAKEIRPDLILMDIRLKGVLDGIAAAEKIRSQLDIPIIYLTANSDEATLQRAKLTEPFGYLLKPFEDRELHTTIQMALYKYQSELAQKELIRELDAFAHTVSHNLRAPLTAVIGYAHMLKDDANLPAESQAYMNLLLRNSRKMNNIIDELLLLAGVRQAEVESKPINMAQVVGEVQQRLAFQIKQHQANLIVPDEWPVALGHAPWVEEVWANYLSNAITYGGRPPCIQLGATKQPNGMVRFWVRDNGPGLTPEQQSQLFTEFTRLNQVKVKGYGLGLSIVQRIVIKLGGEVSVESQVGQGSKFAFTLPGFDPESHALSDKPVEAAATLS